MTRQPTEDFSFIGNGVSVKVRDGDIEKAIRILKKKMLQEGVIRDMRRIEFYEKPSVKRRRIKQEARRRWKRQERMLQEEL